MSSNTVTTIENSDSNNSMSFSCDLASLARQHISFLEQIHESGLTSTTPLSTESLRRYQHLWLPLVANVSASASSSAIAEGKSKEEEDVVMLIPPPDIAWLWHSHRLAPSHYVAYCNHNFQRVLEAHPPFAVALSGDAVSSSESHSVLDQTQALWAEHYPLETYFLSESQKQETDGTAAAPPLLLGFDLMGSAQRQSTFLWHVSGERFADEDFLVQGVDNYKKFLQLRPQAARLHMTLVPTYQIDLIWHTHMLYSTTMYNMDCIRIMNSTMSHDDSHSDRSEGGHLHQAYNATSDLWTREYGTDYAVCGAMHQSLQDPM